MKLPLLLAFACTAFAQVATPVSVTTKVPCSNAAGPKIAPQSFVDLERRFNDQLTRFKDPIDTFGSARAIYLRDYGLMISSEISLIQTPAPMPFRQEIPKELRAQVHERKLAQLPLLKKSMQEMAKTAAMTLVAAIGIQQYESSGLQVAVVVRMVYLPYEDTSGLPAQIIVQANLKNAIAGNFQEEQQ